MFQKESGRKYHSGVPFRCIPRGRQYQSALDRIYHTNALTGKVGDFSPWRSILLGLGGSSLDGTTFVEAEITKTIK